MAMGIQLDSYSDTEDTYTVEFNDHFILTTVTATASVVNRWVSDIYRIHRRRLSRRDVHHFIVGLDVEWRPNFSRNRNPVATLQLCVGHRCLIFQLIYADYIPDSLVGFLSEPDFTFVGVGIAEDVEKLAEDYELFVGQTSELGSTAAEQLGVRDLNRAGLRRLANVVLEVDVEKPRRITMSKWDSEYLSSDQVMYACLDAFLSFEIGRNLF
ncbi:hypothetical protein MRB53_030953 [Persea americana]|uniref:Uncharacterized protein n=1 Tax=Persea americana TaxID=3435 RepID=A0ACC2KN74_PERAE|nr:hypothetical protein MRB53_030953 [Persea americana]|eukprot:TRINITY_DN10735_c0_g1_i1.p1 TRINITY_DN10735_c0_g1~~TRINITY_DN10735_c0_g1_i1.p1  ORF type:complete len:212 (-),score=15.38 TRINITY_DN10735_c0_g1_i1:118-753(-)